MRAILILMLSLIVISCQVQAEKISENQNKKERSAEDVAIYGGLPHLPEKPYPPRIKRKTSNTPTALCNDDNYSFSRNVDYACKGRGGVKNWTYDSDIQLKPDDPKYFED